MSKPLRKTIVRELEKKFAGVETFLVVDYKGLKSTQAAELRSHLREGKIGMTVLNNRVSKFAFESLGVARIKELLKGPTAVVWSREDPAAVTKRVLQWQEKYKILALKGAVVGGQVFAPDQVRALSLLPTREQMLGMVVGTVTAPMSGMAGALNGLLGGLAGALQSLVEKREKAGPS